MEIQKFWERTYFFVLVLAVSFGGCILLQAIVSFLLQHETIGEAIKGYSFINRDFALPLDIFSYAWVSASSVYIGVDRSIYTVKTHHMPGSSVDFGDLFAARRIILLSGILTALTFLCDFFVNFDFPMAETATAFCASITLYIAGQKTIQMAQRLQKKKYEPVEYVDDDGNGVDDRIEPYIDLVHAVERSIIDKETVGVYVRRNGSAETLIEMDCSSEQ